MIVASQLRPGAAIRYQGRSYKVVAVDYRPGQGQMGGAAHARLQDLDTGTIWEHSFRAELRLEEVALEKRSMEFLYSDAHHCCFMDPDSFEQVEIEIKLFGNLVAFLEAGMRLPVEFAEGRPVSATFPDVLEVQIASTAPPLHQQVDSALKPARLPNGVEIMVPQFVKSGDLIRLDMHSLKYMDRARGAARR